METFKSVCLLSAHRRTVNQKNLLVNYFQWVIFLFKKKKIKIFYSSLQGLWEWGEGLKTYFISHLLHWTLQFMYEKQSSVSWQTLFKSEVDKGVNLEHVFKLLPMKTHSLKRSKWQNATNFLGKKNNSLKALRTTKGAWVCAEQHQATCTWIKETVNNMSWFFLGSTWVNKWLQRIKAWVLFSRIGITKLMSKQ